MAKKWGWFDVPLGAPGRTIVTTPEEAVGFINQAFGQPEEYYYSAEQMRQIWRTMLTSGLIPEVRKAQQTTIIPVTQLGSCFALEIGSGMAVSVAAGIGFIDGAYFVTDMPETLFIPEGVSDIVLRLDTSGAAVSFDFAVKPRSVANIADGLSRSEHVFELGLHTFVVPTGTGQITSSMHTDQRLNMTPCSDGNPVCGLVGSLLMPDIDAWYQRAKEVLDELIGGVLPPGTESTAGALKNLNPMADSAAYSGGNYNLVVSDFNFAALLGVANVTFKAPATSTGPVMVSINGGPQLPAYLGEDQADREDVIIGNVYTVGIDKAGGRAFFKSGGGVNATLPAMPTDFAVATGDGKATLSFTPPTLNYGGAIIVRKVGSAPESVRDGTKLEASSGTYIDTGLTNGTTYYWRLFPYNEKRQFQTVLTGAVVSGTPRAVSGFSYTGAYERVESTHPITGAYRYYLILKSSGNLTMLANAAIDAFLVGGAGGGGWSTNAYYSAGGGGGGRTLTVNGYNAISQTAIACVIGAGGQGASATVTSPATNGSNTLFGLHSAAGGSGVYSGGSSNAMSGGNGASGGGAGGNASTLYPAGAGGQNGGNGTGGGGVQVGGTGQGTTTQPFGGDVAPFNNILYSGGGGGGAVFNLTTPGAGGNGGGGRGGNIGAVGVAGTANTGGGGGGCGGYTAASGGTIGANGGAGGSGVIIVRVGDWTA